MEEWIEMLNQPLAGRAAEPSDTELEKDAESFMAAMAAFGGKGA